jgi:hypothetical protein
LIVSAKKKQLGGYLQAKQKATNVNCNLGPGVLTSFSKKCNLGWAKK